jgi:Protein of unknown function (DUF2905)
LNENEHREDDADHLEMEAIRMLPQMGKILIVIGAVFLLVGLLLTFASHLSFWRIGRLPGDIYIKKDNFTFYFPLTTSIVVSLILTLIFTLFSRR